MIYMVEMNLIDKDRRKEWNNWYEEHTNMLLTFPGFHATQRFECMTDAKAPFVALHHVDGPEFFKSDAYTNKAGPRGTGEWRTKMNNWSRNLFQGLETTPNISFNEYLIIIEEACEKLIFSPRFSVEKEIFEHPGGMGSFEETFQSRIDAWVDDLSNKTPPEKVNASAEDALEVQRVIEAAIQSWANGSVVDLKKMD